MHWILVANGDCECTPDLELLLDAADEVVGVDGGGRHLYRLGRRPTVVVGDMDSIPSQILEEYRGQGVRLHLHPPRKDETDLELALNLALANEASQITILAATGGRLDHTLANIFLLTRCLQHDVPATIRDRSQTIRLINGMVRIKGCPGDTLSLLPLTPEVCGVTLAGLEYPLHDDTLLFGSTWGMSNVFADSAAEIRLSSGLLLVIHQHQPAS